MISLEKIDTAFGITPEMKQKWDSDFRAQLLGDIPYFHSLYKKYHDPLALETAKNLGVILKNFPLGDRR